jgi:hypothetical protein
MTEPGDYRVAQALREVSPGIDIVTDTHFLCTIEDFRHHSEGRKQLRMEFFYREMRRRYQILMDDTVPAGGEWNYDSENRGSFGKRGPGLVSTPVSFAPDRLTRQVLTQVNELFASHPGKLNRFDWPVTPVQAEEALQDFLDNRLAGFGEYQDAMWTGQPLLYHARLSVALNLKLINPRRIIAAAEERYRSGKAPLASTEGFIRQILGWREYVRGIYWLYMPGYAGPNGIKLFGGAAYITNTGAGTIIRVPILPDGSAGVPSIYASGLALDDFAFGADGSLFLATQVENSVIRLFPDGTRSIIATQADGLLGDSALAFGRTATDSRDIYVVNNGGAYEDLAGGQRAATVVRLAAGVTGAALGQQAIPEPSTGWLGCSGLLLAALLKARSRGTSRNG